MIVGIQAGWVVDGDSIVHRVTTPAFARGGTAAHWRYGSSTAACVNALEPVRRAGARRLRRGLYALPHEDQPPRDRDRLRVEAALAGASDTSLRGVAAASWLTSGQVSMPALVTFRAPPGQSLRRPGLSQLDLSPDELVVADGVRCTSPARTTCDLLRLAPRLTALIAVDALTNQVLTTPALIAAELDRRQRQRGLVRARTLLLEVEPNAGSPRETLLRLLLTDGGLPRPEAQCLMFDGDGRFLARADLANRRLRLALEYLCRVHAGQLDDDWERHNALASGAWLTLGFTDRSLRQPPERIVQRVLAAAAQQHVVLGLAGPLTLA